MPGSHADDIVGEFLESEDWALLADDDPEPDFDLPPLPPPTPDVA